MKPDLPSDSSPAAGRTKPLDWPRAAGNADAVARAIEDYARLRRRARVAAAAGCATLLLLAGLAWRGGRDSREPVAATGRAVVSQPERRVLPDGSLVELKPGAGITVEFAAGENGPRRVVLQGGEAHFSVTKDPARPFIVEAGVVAVRAVGTAFSVQHGRAQIEVLVTEGRVAVDRSVAPAPATASVVAPPPLALIDAGNRAVVANTQAAAAAEVHTVSVIELGERLGWRVPRLEFDATPLGEVVAMFNRHAVSPAGVVPAKLTLADPALASLPLSGRLRADNLGVLFQILETSYGIRPEQRGAAEIVLHR